MTINIATPTTHSANLPSAAPAAGGEAASQSGSNAASNASSFEIIIESLIGIGQDVLDYLPLAAIALVVLLLVWLVIRVSRWFIVKGLQRTSMRKSLKDLILRLLTITMWAIGLLLVAMVLFPGLTPTRALSALGLVSIAVGLAFKDIFENFFAGILLLWKFPFEDGDFIECNGILGRVERVSVRMTTIRKVSGELVVVPNAMLFKNPVDVLTNKPFRRARAVVGIDYDEDTENASAAIRAAVEQSSTAETVRHDIEIFVHAFGGSSVDIEVCWWTKPTPLQMRDSVNEVLGNIKRVFDERGISIPFPHRTLLFKNELGLEGRAASTEEGRA